MAKMDYPRDAETIVHALGGKGSIKRVSHCMTQVRVYVKKKNLIDEQSIQKLPEVTGTNWNNDQFQIICGAYVGGIYNELTNLGVPNDDTDTSQTVTNKNEGIVSRIVDAIAGRTTPIIPALTAAGMIKVTLILCTALEWVSQTSGTCQVISFVADAMYYFLPFSIAASTARVFRVNQSLASPIAGVFLHPNFVKMVLAKAPTLFFGIPVFKYDHSYSVIPIILMVWVMSYITKFVKKVSPGIIRLILEPTLIIIVSVPLVLLIVGSIGGILGTWLAEAIKFLSAHLGFVIVGLLAAAFPYIVMTEMHYALTPISLNAVATGGGMLIFISQVYSDVAQGGAALAVAVRSRQKNMKQLGSATGISALMGMAEPALYGVALKLERPLVTAIIATGIGGLVDGLLQVTLYISQNCLLALPASIGGYKSMLDFALGVTTILISFILSFVLTLVMGFEGDGKHKVALAENVTQVNESSQSGVEQVAIHTPTTVYAPIPGKVLPLSEVPDKTFADKTMGDGLVINPVEGKVYAPDDGKIVSIMSTKHGVMLQTKDEVQLLIHIGMDTVNLKGKYFTAHIETGDSVKKGDLLIEFDQKAIEKEGYNLITPIIVLDSKDYQEIKPTSKVNIVVEGRSLNLE